MTGERVVGYYLKLVARCYRNHGRYGYTSEDKEPLRRALLKKYPELSDVIEKVYEVTSRELDDFSDQCLRWPNKEQILRLQERILEESVSVAG